MSKKTIIYNNVHHGDWVRCNDCETTMLLPVCADKCPECGAEGTLEWANDNESNHTVDATDIDFPDYLDDDVDIVDCYSNQILEEVHPELCYMRCTNMYALLQKMQNIEATELIAAVKAHNGLYQFGKESENGECDLGECPIVMANPDCAEPAPIDVYILQVRLIGENKDELEIYGIEKECHSEVYLSPSDIAAGHICFITENIRMTYDVKSVCGESSFNVKVKDGDIKIKNL